ncbi:cupin domain-containing protein [Epibacterium ulvae]|uniref:cupin domain-containing protein n=1 Tax=Epibacterium ulvae TaxID=1156985 RepID=UPI001BFC2D32|nr:cupin domain-containing protein [Epibacterium ulvae]MBT8153978.1 cupin domain-containing protein [Epibacterium ulvae]
MNITNKEKAAHYLWQDVCDGWPFVATEALSVKQEKMPPDTYEIRHFHKIATQFFYVLSGVLTLEVEGSIIKLSAQDGLQIDNGTVHQARNEDGTAAEFLVVSSPSTANDRHEV